MNRNNTTMDANIFFTTTFLMMLAFTTISGFTPMGNHKGKSFILSFLKNGYGYGDVYVLVFATEDTTVSVTNNFMKTTNSYKINANSSMKLTLDKTLRYDSISEAVEDKTVTILSPVDISVYVIDYNTYSADGYLAIPVKYLADKYLAVSYTANKYSPVLVIAATQDKTTVTVLLKIPPGANCSGTHRNGDMVTFYLGINQNVGIFCSADLTGSYVTSDKPVSVISGQPCANVPDGIDGVDLLMEMLVPIQALGSNFVLHNLGGRDSGAIYRTVASENNTSISTSTGLTFNLNFGEYRDMDTLTTGEMFLQSTHPVLVVMYAKGKKADNVVVDGDGFMSQIPPTDRFMSEYLYDADQLTDFRSYYANTALTSDVKLDPRFHQIPGSDYSVYSHSINGSQNRIEHGGINFGGVVYGFKKTAGYGFPLGIVLDFDDCESSPCVNGGSCTDGVYSYTCACMPSFSGVTCEKPILTTLSSTSNYSAEYMTSTTLLHTLTTTTTLTTSSEPPTSTITSTVSSTPSSTSLDTPASQSLSESSEMPSTVLSSLGLTPSLSTSLIPGSSTAFEAIVSTSTSQDLQASSNPGSLSTSSLSGSELATQLPPTPLPGLYTTLCTCRCFRNLSTIDTSKINDEIKKALLVPTNNLSSTTRKKISIPDSRPSAIAVGYLGIVAVVLLTTLLTVPDIISIMKFFFRCEISDRGKRDSDSMKTSLDCKLPGT